VHGAPLTSKFAQEGASSGSSKGGYRASGRGFRQDWRLLHTHSGKTCQRAAWRRAQLLRSGASAQLTLAVHMKRWSTRRLMAGTAVSRACWAFRTTG